MDAMRRIVFYSWQSDLPNSCNRGFIQAALEQAADAITADDSVAVEPVVDRDTQNVPGSPDIASTIFAKIAGADIFVADVSIVVAPEGRRACPNPNVLIELGYALKTLGYDRVILVFNTAFGRLEQLPFDLRSRRVLAYEMKEDAAERAPARKALARHLEAALRGAVSAIPETGEDAEPAIPAADAIENARPNKIAVLRRNLADLFTKLRSLEPRMHRDGGTVEELIQGLDRTQPVVAEVSRIAEITAVMNDVDSSLEIVRWFGNIFDLYELPENFSGRYSEADQDFFRFIGHEMFVTFVAFLLKERRWPILRQVLDEPIPTRTRRRARSVNWEAASSHVSLLLDESKKRSRISIHADLLNKRHSEGGALATILPMEELMNADFFLFLASGAVPDGSGFRFWRAWSCMYLKTAPVFLIDATWKQHANGVLQALGLRNVDELKKLVTEYGPQLGKLYSRGHWWYPIEAAEIEAIGTR